MSRTFTAEDLAAAAGLRPAQARMALRGFVELGLVEQNGEPGRFRATEAGLTLSAMLAAADDREPRTFRSVGF